MVDVAESDSWQLRYVAGPGAQELLALRRSMSDEEWVALHGTDDATFQRLMSGASPRSCIAVGATMSIPAVTRR
jgi:hypothetical protein